MKKKGLRLEEAPVGREGISKEKLETRELRRRKTLRTGKEKGNLSGAAPAAPSCDYPKNERCLVGKKLSEKSTDSPLENPANQKTGGNSSMKRKRKKSPFLPLAKKGEATCYQQKV